VLTWTAATAVGLAGVGGCSADGRPLGLGPPRIEPDTALRAAVVEAKRKLLEAYDATARRHPGLRKLLAPLHADHAAHLDVLGAHAPGPTTAATPAPSASSAPTVPVSARAALRALAGLESAAAAQRVRDSVAADSPELARLLAAIGGCEAVHATLLNNGAA
jgi:hypothetical protein